MINCIIGSFIGTLTAILGFCGVVYYYTKDAEKEVDNVFKYIIEITKDEI